MSKQKEKSDILDVDRFPEFEVLNFDSSEREKSCIEVDFPLVSVNRVAAIEGSSGSTRKPIYKHMKWFARRSSAVFRSLLISSTVKYQPNINFSLPWRLQYKNLKSTNKFSSIKVADIFMGGGTTIVEALRLGCEVYGNDLSPIAWLVVKNQTSCLDRDRIKSLFDKVEKNVGSQINHYYVTKCHREKCSSYISEKSKPTVTYTFWAKHAICQSSGCKHLTPLISNPHIIERNLTIKVFPNVECTSCGKKSDVELDKYRIAESAERAYSDEEEKYSILDVKNSGFICCHCNKFSNLDYVSIKEEKKSIKCSIYFHPEFAKGIELNENLYDGEKVNVEEWYKKLERTQKIIEVRDKIKSKFTLNGLEYSIETIKTSKGGKYTCQNETCGRLQECRNSFVQNKEQVLFYPYLIHGYCEHCDRAGHPYNGRFYSEVLNVDRYVASLNEWERRKECDLKEFWPKSELPYGFMTHKNNGGLPTHGFDKWFKMFNPLQLLVLSQLLKSICTLDDATKEEKEFLLGSFQQYLRNQSMFVIWDRGADQITPMLSNTNFAPKLNVVENSVFSDKGRGNWYSCRDIGLKTLEWLEAPDELAANVNIEQDFDIYPKLTGKSTRIQIGDLITKKPTLSCKSATDLAHIKASEVDLVVTDPPFGGLLHYSELADFFYVWLRLALKNDYPEIFGHEFTPKTLEAVANKARNPDDADEFYKNILTESWKEAFRILKPGGLLVFTFHHSSDDPWVDVLESLFNAGFYLEATYPIRSDETKGQGSKPGTFGSQKIEYDIVHVCRKKSSEPVPVSWAKVRKKLLRDVEDIRDMIENHLKSGLPEADLKVIKCGKALEYYSRHYDQVYIEDGRHFTVKEALAGVTQFVLDDQKRDEESPPSEAEPLTRHFLRIFKGVEKLPRDQVQKMTRWSGVGPSDFLAKGWIVQKGKDFIVENPLDIAADWKGKHRSNLARDYDQAMFLIGACYEGSGINVKDTLNNKNFKVHPAISPILKWFSKYGATSEIKDSAQRADRIYQDWIAKNKEVVDRQLLLFEEVD